MNQSAASQPSRKKAVFSLLILLALTCVIVLIFRDHWAEITAALAQLNLWQVLVVLALGISYPLLEGCVSYVIVRGRLPGFTLRQGIDNAWCGTFGNVVTLGAGVVPVQTWYLHQAGLPIGPGVGLMTLQYVFHKTTVLLYATVMLLLQHKWLAANTTGVLKYLPMAYAVVALVIVALVLVCVSPLVQNLARWALGFLPKTEKWQQRRADWLEQLDVLGTESRLLLADKARCVQIFALQALKLFLLFCQLRLRSRHAIAITKDREIFFQRRHTGITDGHVFNLPVPDFRGPFAPGVRFCHLFQDGKTFVTAIATKQQ